MKSHLLIGAASSGSGKTTFTLGLLRALKNRYGKVRPFKCGPDYIDTRHHKMAAGCPSVNLDSFMMSEQHIRDLYRRYTSVADYAVTEGVMGLFDGYDAMQGSSAEIARTLNIPVVLIVNAKSTAYSVAPLLSFLKQACEDAGVEALGYLPKQADVEIPSRYLGLTLDEAFCFDTFADRVAALVEKHVDIDRLLALTACQPVSNSHIVQPEQTLPSPLKILIARDAAFNFAYEENIQLLHRLGEVSFFSPLHDSVLPESDFVYLPGGYPELYLSGLSSNRSMLQSVRDYAEAGGKLLAECGGMMYLCNRIKSSDGNSFPMVGLLNQSTTMEQMKLRLGYRTLYYNDYVMTGHEFHYSRIEPQKEELASVATACTAKGSPVATPLYRYKNVLAGYTHLYWGDPLRNQWFIDYLNGLI